MSLIPAPTASAKEGGNGTRHLRMQSASYCVAPRLQHNGTPSGFDSFSGSVHDAAKIWKRCQMHASVSPKSCPPTIRPPRRRERICSGFSPDVARKSQDTNKWRQGALAHASTSKVDQIRSSLSLTRTLYSALRPRYVVRGHAMLSSHRPAWTFRVHSTVAWVNVPSAMPPPRSATIVCTNSMTRAPNLPCALRPWRCRVDQIK